MPYSIYKSFSFCYGHRLFGDKGKCGHLHGHSAKVEIKIRGAKLDELGMVENFDKLKSKIGAWIEQNLDHKMILNKKDPLAVILKKEGEPCFLLDTNPTAENLARLLYDIAQDIGFNVVKVKFWESETSKASYKPR